MATVLFNKIKLGGANAISISYSSSEIKYVKHGDGTLYYDTQSSTIYDTPSISLSYGSQAPAKGGTLSPSLSYSQKWRKVGYSGNTYEQTASASGATVSYSISGAGASIDPSTGVVTWNSLGTTISDGRTAEVTVTVTKSGQSNTAKYTVRQGANSRTVKSTSGGVVTYGAVTAGTIKNATVSAAGGSGTATAGNGSQPWSKTAVITTYEYTSGSTLSEQTAAATSGTNTISPSVASISATGSNLGTTEKAEAILKQQAVKWPGNGNKSASGTMRVYQEANKIISTKYAYSNLYCTLTNNFTASGGSAEMGVFVDKTPTYTWTSTKTSTGSTVSTNVTSNATKTINQQYFHSSDGATSGTAIDRFTISGSTIEHSSMYAFVGYDYVSFKATYEGLTATSEVYNIRNTYHYIYNWKTLSINYPTINSSGISALKPLVSGTQTYTIKYTSGHSGVQNTTDITTVSFDSLTVSGTGCSVYDAKTGTIMWRANTSTSSRSATISGQVTANGVSKSFSTTAIQEGKEEEFYNYSIIIQEENGSPDINIVIDGEEDFDLNNNHDYSGIIEELNNYVLYEGYSSKSTPSLGFTVSYPGSWKPEYFTVEIMGDGQITTGQATVYPSYGQEYHYVVKCSGASLNGTGTIDVNIKEYY